MKLISFIWFQLIGNIILIPLFLTTELVGLINTIMILIFSKASLVKWKFSYVKKNVLPKIIKANK